MTYVRQFNLGESPYFDVKDPHSPLWGILRGMLYGSYEHVVKEMVLEKDRGWAQDTELLQHVLKVKPKMLATVRPIPDIISSFIVLSRRIGTKSKLEDELRETGRSSNSWTLSRIVWEKYIYSNWRAFKTGYEKNPEFFLLVNYDNLVDKPDKTMEEVCSYLGVDYCKPKAKGLVNPNPENDAIYGMPGLHEVRADLRKTSLPAQEVLGEDCYQFWKDLDLEFWGKTT